MHFKRIAIAIGLIGFVTAVPRAVAGEIRWSSGTDSVNWVASAEAAQHAAALRPLRGARGRHIVVQFDSPVTDAERATLAAAGLALQGYLGDNAYFALVSAQGVRAADAALVTKLCAAVDVKPEWKLHRSFVDREIMRWALVAGDAIGAELEDAAGEALPSEGSDDRQVAVYVLFHSDVTPDEAAAIAAQNGGDVRSRIRSVNGLVVEIPYQNALALADEDAVKYVEPPLPFFEGWNDSNRAITGADQAQAAPYNLDGSGVTVLVYDSGNVLATHPDLIGRVRIGDADTLADHSTHVAGTVGGNGAASGGLRRGMAPGVMIDSYGYATGVSLEQGFLYTDPADMEADFYDSVIVHGADISNSSIGTNVAGNGFPCSWEGDYSVVGSVIDALVAGSLGVPFRVVWAASNERGNGRCGESFFTIAPPAAAKNHLSIGALNSNNDSMTSFSGWGPTDDGRIKPDFAGPGCQVGSDNGVTSTSGAGGYNAKCGTSMSSPSVTGLAALLLQDFRAQYPGSPDPRNSTLKAVFAQTAVDIDNVGPDFRTGFGSVRIVPAVDLVRAGNFLEAPISQGEVRLLSVVVPPGQAQLKVTIAWDDVPASPNVVPTLVNDIDLVVVDAANATYFPWTLDAGHPAVPAIRTQADHVNNIEQVVIDNPPAGYYLVRLTGFNVPEGPQVVSVAASHTLLDCSRKAALDFDRTAYGCGGTAQIVLNDCDLNTDDGAVETIQVLVTSESEPAGETVTLTETSVDSARFTGSVATAVTDAPGIVHATDGDTLTVAHTDADDGFGGVNVPVADSAPVDCAAPAISNVAAQAQNARTVQVTFITTEPALAEVHYGLSCPSLTLSAADEDLHSSHEILLTSLNDATTYYYVVAVTDPAGNSVVDTNGGACYQVATPVRREYHTELFTGDFDLPDRAITFTPNGGPDFYTACSYPTAILPTDPAGGVNLSLDDGGSAQVFLADGQQVRLFGAAYGAFYINANGNITFDSADSDGSETTADHFAYRRIAALFDDLDPLEGGQVSWKQLPDRAVVTWFGIPQDAIGDSNTLQVSMYFDGRIQLAWLGVGARDGLVGLSAGTGVPADFFESDLSATPSCGPRPPTAASQSVVLGKDREINIDLLALDEGEPAPPGALQYVISALPAQELRDAGNDHRIAHGELPYTLSGGGRTVVYAPTNGFMGSDAFAFKARDGGAPPSAGDSNIATVTIQVEQTLNLPFSDTFPITTVNTAKWIVTGEVRILSQDLPEPSSPYSANLNGFPQGRDELRSFIIDLSEEQNVHVSVYHMRGGDLNATESGENLWVEFVDSNGDWQTLAEYPGDGGYEYTFTLDDIALPVAAYHENFRLRVRNRGTASTTNLDDWFIDDVRVYIPNAPVADSASAHVVLNDILPITLSGSDPNGVPLSYVIMALPAHGTLTDPGAGVILQTPYTIPGGARVVHYQRQDNFVGEDPFVFRVNNGSMQSNAATINVVIEPVMTLPLEDAFVSTTFDTNLWALADAPTIDGVGLNIPSQPYAARFNGVPNNADELRSYAFNLAGMSDVHLRYDFQRCGGGDSPESGDDLFFEFQAANDSWQLLSQQLGNGADMTTFQAVDVTLPAGALHGRFRLRIRNTGSASQGDDWFVDNVRVFSTSAPSAGNRVVKVRKSGWATVVLPATDPTQDPLSRVIGSLPTNGSLYDMQASYGPISTADLPYTVAGQATSVLYVPRLGLEGADAFTFRAFDGVYHSNLGVVSIDVTTALPVYEFDMESNPGWTAQGQWAWGIPQGQIGDPTAGYSGSNVYGYNLAGRYANNLPATYLTTSALDLSQVTGVQLQFRRWLRVEDSSFDHAAIEISNNGVNWSTVWNHTTGNLFESAWSLQTYDLSAVADEHAQVYVRWNMGPTDSSGNFGGWNIDDVLILGQVEAAIGDIDRNGQVDLADLRGFGECMAGPFAAPAPAGPATPADCLTAFDLDTDGDVDMADFLRFQALFNAD